jgi:hypothetical protein
MNFKATYLDLIWIIGFKSFDLNVMVIILYFGGCYKPDFNNNFLYFINNKCGLIIHGISS